LFFTVTSPDVALPCPQTCTFCPREPVFCGFRRKLPITWKWVTACASMLASPNAITLPCTSVFVDRSTKSPSPLSQQPVVMNSGCT
jgi:hypothetical protein